MKVLDLHVAVHHPEERGVPKKTYFDNPEAAAAYAKKPLGWWNSEGSTQKEKILVFSSVAEVESWNSDEKRRAALDKLSPEERVLLGLA